MRKHMRSVGILALIAAAPSLHAQSTTNPTAPNAQGDVAVTIYNNQIALVQDVRQLNIGAGKTRQEFPDVAAHIQPQTVSFNAAGTAIVEQNFDYDLLSPNALMEKAVGETVTLIRTNPATGAETRERAKVLAVNGGVVLQIGERVEILRDDGLPVRVIFDRIPENLRAKPTLSITLNSKQSGTRPATLTYLTGGMGWLADYVSLYDETTGTIDVQGWVTLTNNSGTTFKAAETLLVAGNPGGGDNNSSYYDAPRGKRNIRQAGTETSNREQLGDFYLYPLPERTTIANAQTKQVSFLDVQKVPAQKAYEYTVGWGSNMDEAESAELVIKFNTSRDGGLGDALPAGTVRFYMRDRKGDPQFIGESAIDHTPMGSSLGLGTAKAFDVKVKAFVKQRDKIDSGEWERSARYRIWQDGNVVQTVQKDTAITYYRTVMEYEVTNARNVPVTVDVTQTGLDEGWHDTRVPNETITGVQTSRGERTWVVPVPANGKTVLTVTFDTRY